MPCEHGTQAVFLRNMADDGMESDLKAAAAAGWCRLFLRHAVREPGLKVLVGIHAFRIIGAYLADNGALGNGVFLVGLVLASVLVEDIG